MKTIVAKILIVLSLTGAQVLGYPPQGRLSPDGAPVPADAVEHEDSVASASETGEEYEDSDDSDMYMEPDGAETDESGKEQQTDDEANTTEQVPSVVVTTEGTGEAANSTRSGDEPRKWSRDQQAENTKETGETDASSPEDDKSLETDSQNFFPSFAELFANHRLSFAEQQRYRPNRFLGYLQRDRSGYQTAAATAKDPLLLHHPLLGSGNFGVIRGGTYYPEEKENDEYATDDGSLYSPYYHGGSRGGSRANYLRNPKPQPIRGGDFFANFRDFADITAPPKSSFSHLSVVYANKNDSSKSDAAATGRITEPRNIIETLRMLEEEAKTTEPPPRKKQSKGKWKLAKMRQHEEDKARRSRMTVEPLLALS